MKFSFRQIFASAGGAVLAAVIASFFGVKGTIVGVAIGSAAATFGTAFVAQSIDQGHKAVKQVVVRVPDTSHLLRRLGGTGAAGVTTLETTSTEEPSLAEETTTAARQAEETPPTDIVAPSLAEPRTEVVMTSGAALAPAKPRGVRWPVIAGTVAIVFVLSLMFVTAVELIAGRPLADLFGGHVKGDSPSIVRVFKTSPAPPTTSTSTSTTTTSTSTTTTSTTTTTTTTVPGSTTTSTDDGSGTSTTTTTGVDATTTTTSPG